MGIRKIESKETFRTADGQEFEDESAAKKHEEITTAKAYYENSRDRYARILWETQITADGHLSAQCRSYLVRIMRLMKMT